MSAQPGFRSERVSQLRVPPQAIDAEQAVLGGLMISPQSIGQVKLDEGDFYRRDHQLIFRAILDLDSAGKPFDAVTLGDWFDASGQSDVVSGGYLIELANSTWSAANIAAHASIIRERSVLRSAIQIGSGLVQGGFDPEGRTSSEVIDAAVRELMALSKAECKAEFTMREAVNLAFEDANEAHMCAGSIRGIPTGFAKIDKRLGGFHRGDLVILAARPSMGKTALMVNLAANAAAAGFSVGMISGEQSAMQIGQRSIAVEGRVPAERMRNGDIDEEMWPRLSDAVRKLIDRRVRIYDRSAPSLDEIARVARRWKQEHGIGILYVDYLQRIKCKAENRVEEVSEVARGLKTLARDLDIPIVALAQVKAEVDKRVGDKRPNIGDVANSDEATREADQIGFLYRDEVYNDNAVRGAAELNIEKNRHGPTGQFRLRFHGETMTFSDAPADTWGGA